MPAIELELDLGKSLEENASRYFEGGKKAKKKLGGVLTAIPRTEKRMARLREEKTVEGRKAGPRKRREKEWFEKFHWFKSSDGFLVVGGRDAKSNEGVVKKQMQGTDIYFHADVQGAPHTLVKAGDGSAPETTLKEAAQFAAVFSRAWKNKTAFVDVYSVKPDQVSKKAPAGEALGKGAFMVYGERVWYRKVPMELFVGVEAVGSGYRVVSGPGSAIKKAALYWRKLVQGPETKGAMAKKVKRFFDAKLQGDFVEVDEINGMLPAGEFRAEE